MCRFLVLAALLFAAPQVFTQDKDNKSRKEAPLFASDSLLKLTITGDVKPLLRDKGQKEDYYPITVHYTDGDSMVAIDLKARLRGHFRRESGNCNLPPILLNFPGNDTVKHSLFRKQDKLKLVVTCVRGDYVQREYLIYKIYQMLTPQSLKVKLVEITFQGEKLSKSERSPFIGYLIEAEDDMAKRNDAKLMAEDVKLSVAQIDPEAYMRMVLFEYMIANVDWSAQYQHNVRLLDAGDGQLPIVVPYDFDHSGLVDAPYAMPPAELNMSSVRERRYRGACDTNVDRIKNVASLFLSKQEDILNLYRTTTLISESSRKRALSFLEEFFSAIGNEQELAKIVSTNCDPAAGGNIIIQGLPKTKN